MTTLIRFLAESNLTRQNNENDNDARVRTSAVQLMSQVYGPQVLDALYNIMSLSFFVATVTGTLGFIQIMRARSIGFKCDVPLDLYLFLEIGLALFPLVLALFFRILPSRDGLSGRNKKRIEIAMLIFTVTFELCKFGVHIFGIVLLVISETCEREENSIFRNVAACAGALIVAQVTYIIQFILFEIVVSRLRRGKLSTPATEAITKVKNFQIVPGSDEVCSICLNEMDEPHRKTPCNHEFHENCLISWVSASAKNCPICRTNFIQQPNQHQSIVIAEPSMSTDLNNNHPREEVTDSDAVVSAVVVTPVDEISGAVNDQTARRNSSNNHPRVDLV